MALELPDFDSLSARILSFFRNRWPGKDDHSESFLGKMASAIAMALFGLIEAVEQVAHDAVPTEHTSLDALRTWANAIGVPADTEGTYGQKGAKAASGGRGLLTGTNGTVFADGTVATAADGRTQVALSGAVAIPGAPPGKGSVVGSFVALTPGKRGNLGAGARLTWEAPPSGADGGFVLVSPLDGGQDEESKESLFDRTRARLRNAPKGGTAPDYRGWVESVTGVARAYVYPLRGGTGAVHVVATSGGSGLGRRPSDSVRIAADGFVRTVRPVTVAGYATLLPTMAARGLALRMRIEPVPSARFDWSSRGVSLTVASYQPAQAAAPAQLALSAAPPPDLVQSIARRQRPRLQLVATGPLATAAPFLVECAEVNGNTLTLVEGPANGILNAGDVVLPGSDAVLPLASALIAHVDGLGPSRESGFADPNDFWEDTLTIARMIQLALEVRAGERRLPVCRNVVPGGVTIDGAAADRRAADRVLDAPELLYVGSVAISD
jgi:uncharacterized phage protein gp47/JayE